MGSDYKVRCAVMGRPQPYVDWFRHGKILTTDDRYVIDNTGLLIKNVNEADDGVYICSAVVLSTGNIKTRTIKVRYFRRIKSSILKYLRIKDFNDTEALSPFYRLKYKCLQK